MKIEELIKKAFKSKLLADKYASEYNALRSKLQGQFEKSKHEQVIVDNVVVSKRQRIEITYFIDKLRKKLSKGIFKKVTIRKYYIKDLEGLVEILKEAGIKPEHFKKFIDVQIDVDKKVIQELFEVGEITKKNLEGCYDAKIVNYLDIREGKGDTD